MTHTKKIITRHNKTRKIFTGKTIPCKLNDSLNKLYNESSREKALACYLANNNNVKNFSYKIFWHILTYWRKNYPKKWRTIISNEFLEKIGDNKIIEKIGFTVEERNILLDMVVKNKREIFFDYLNDKFFKVTSVLNNLSKPDFAFYHVNVSKHLQQIFISNLKKLFLLENFTWNSFTKMYNSSPKSYRKSYNFFIFNIIVYGSNDPTNMSLYKKNLVYFDFIKKNLPPEKKNKSANLKRVKTCNKSSVSYPDYSDYSIYDARNVYEVDKKMPYAKIMDKLGEPYLSGPSGSTAILYINLFEFYRFPEDKKNKIMLLCVIIADYIPLWHTLAEILLSANVELHSYGISNYELEDNPIDYVDKLIREYL
jgi:hypothetical protein